MSRTALYRHFDAEGRLLYVGITDHLGERDKQHAATSVWHHAVIRSDVQWCLSREHAAELERVAIRHEGPLHNITHRPSPVPEIVEAKVFKSAITRIALPADGGNPILREYLRSQPGAPMQAWADRFGISRPFLYGLLDGDRFPSLHVAKHIETVTHGAVPVSSWPNMAAVISATREAS